MAVSVSPLFLLHNVKGQEILTVPLIVGFCLIHFDLRVYILQQAFMKNNSLSPPLHPQNSNRYHITPLPLDGSHLSTMTAFSCPQGGRYAEVRL